MLAWIVIGWIAGTIAKFLVPSNSNEALGPGETILLGVAGAFVGGFLSNLLLGGDSPNGINLSSVITAAIGAIVLIGLLRILKK